MPTAPIEALIGALHSQLSAEFRTATRSSSAPSNTAIRTPRQRPSSAPVPPQGRTRLAVLGGSTLPMGGAGPLPGLLERAASKVADPTASDPSGTDEGMRVSLQTMYLDERVHISRCTTRGLAGLCAVHVRPEAAS